MVTDMEEVFIARDSHHLASGRVVVGYVLPDEDGNVTHMITPPNGNGYRRSQYGPKQTPSRLREGRRLSAGEGNWLNSTPLQKPVCIEAKP